MLRPDDISAVFEWVELLLIKSLKRNLSRHKQEEQDEGFNWTAWQAEKLRNVDTFRRQSKAIMDRYTDVIDSETRELLEEQFAEGVNGADVPPAESVPDTPAEVTPEPHFFGVDKTKVNKLIEDVSYLEKNAETAALRLTDDVYRQTVNRVQFAMSTGSISYGQAVDMAVADFLTQGINCIEYKDGRRVNIADYVRMVLRTTSTRAALQGKSAKFKAQGYDTVLVSSYGMCSKTCLPWQGRAYIEDTFSYWDGEVEERNGILYGKSNYCGKWFPLLSSAIEKGLFHPNCRHSINQYIDGVTKLPEPIDNSDSERRYKEEQVLRSLEREVRKAKRKVEGFTDAENIKKAKAELREAQKNVREYIAKVNAEEGGRILVRDPVQEKIYEGEDVNNQHIDKYPNSDIIETRDNKPEIPEEIINDVNEAVDKVAEDFPIIREQVEPIVYTNTGDALGDNGLLPNRAVNVVRLSDDYCSDYDKLRQKLADDFESHFSYETDNVGSLACHELGHALHKILAMKRAGVKYGEVLTPIKKKIFEQELQKIKGEVYLAAFSDETLEEIDDACIGELGTMTYRNPDELIAQSFGNYYYGKSKSQVGKAIVEYFKRGLV